MAGKSRDARIRIIGEDDTGRATASVEANLRRINDRVKKTGGDTKAEVTGTFDGVLKHLASSAGSIIGAMTDTGAKAGSAMVGSFGTAIQAMGPEVQAAVMAVAAGAAAILSTFVGGALTGAILGGAASSALVAGIALATRDPDVADAFTAFGQSALDQLTVAAEGFSAPLIRAAGTFGTALSSIMPDIKGMFDAVAPSIDIVVSGITGMIKNAMPGLRKAVEAGAPIINHLAGMLPQLGAAVNDFFVKIASQGANGMRALDIAMRAVITGVKFLGTAIQWLSAAFGLGMDGMVKFTTLMAKLTAFIPGVGDAFKRADAAMTEMMASMGMASTSTGRLGGAMGDVQRAVDKLRKTLAELFDQSMSLDQATLAYSAALLQLRDSLTENGKSLDLNTAKGQANRTAILGAIQSAKDMYDANIASGMAADSAGAAYQRQISDLEAVLRKAGLTKAQIDQLLAAYRAVPNTVRTTIEAMGVAETKQALSSVAIAASLVPRRIPISIAVSGMGQIEYAAQAVRSLKGGTGSWWGQAAAQGQGRTQPATTPDINLSTNVFLDGKLIQGIARTEISKATGRTAWRATAGRH